MINKGDGYYEGYLDAVEHFMKKIQSAHDGKEIVYWLVKRLKQIDRILANESKTTEQQSKKRG